MKDTQTKIEADPVGRFAITCLIVFALLTLTAFNLPASRIQRALARLGEPLRNGVGLDQAWGVFAPNPPTSVYHLEARITYDDGTHEVWVWPKGDPFISEYRAYHWQKWAEQARLGEHRALWQPLAEWLARTHVQRDRHPVEIALVRRWYKNNPPDARPSRGLSQEETFYTFLVDRSPPPKGST